MKLRNSSPSSRLSFFLLIISLLSYYLPDPLIFRISRDRACHGKRGGKRIEKISEYKGIEEKDRFGIDLEKRGNPSFRPSFETRTRLVKYPHTQLRSAATATLRSNTNYTYIRVCAPEHLPVPLPLPAYRHEFMRGHTDTRAPLHRPIIRIISTPSQSCHRHVHFSTCARHRAEIPE